MIEIDVDHQIKAVRRNVGTRTIDTGEARRHAVSQSSTTPSPADLWDAVTNIERIPRWFLPISGDLKVGGSYQLEGHANGTILTCDPPKKFTATWEYGGNVSWIDVSISGDGPDRAQLVVEHIVDGGRRELARVRPGRRRDGLGFHVARAGHPPEYRRIHRPVVRAAVDGHRGRSSFLTLSGEGWHTANVAGRRGSRGGARVGRSMHQGVPRRGNKTRTRSSQGGTPEIFSRRCTTRHLSRLPG